MTLRTIRLTLAYDGREFCGWQIQPGRRSVQAELERAVAQLTGSAARVHGAGRTDAGVHALGQVAHFRTESRLPLARLHAGLQHFLPPDVCITAVAEAAPDFHARLRARRKLYRYVLENHSVRSPFLRGLAGHCAHRLDLAAMRDAARLLVGRRNFSSFQTDASHSTANPVRTLFSIEIARSALASWPPAAPRTSTDDGPLILFDFVGDGFLYNMVRRMVGALVEIGRGHWTLGDLARLLHERPLPVPPQQTPPPAAKAAPTAPADGLYLVSVDYDD
jgi:tRNA pseudouridine38-40 synthase